MTDSLDVALGDATRRYRERNPKSARLARAATEVMPGGNTRSVLHTEPFGIRVDGAEGAVLTTVDGDQVVDLLGDYSAGLLGRRPEMAEAVRGVLDRGWDTARWGSPRRRSPGRWSSGLSWSTKCASPTRAARRP